MSLFPDAGALARLRAAVRARLHDNWRELLLNAWSVRFALIAAACDGVAMLCGFFTDVPGPARAVFAVVGMLCTIAAPIARLIPQTNVNGGGA